MKDPPDVDGSFRVEGQVPGEDTEIIMKKYEPGRENGDASVDAGGDASCAVGAVRVGGAGDDMEITIDNFEPPREYGDAFVDAGGVVSAGNVGGEARCAGGVVGVGEDTEITNEKSKPPQEDGDASVDASPPASVAAGGDASCAAGAVGSSGKEYVRHDDGTVSRQREDGRGAGGVADYVRNDDGTVSRPWEDPRNILFESKTTLILDINGVWLTSLDKRYRSQKPTYWFDLEIVNIAGVFAGYIRDAHAFLDWCLVHFDAFVWTCSMKTKAENLLSACFPDQFPKFKEILAQQDCVTDARIKITGRKPAFYKKLSDFWEKRGQYTATSTILVDDTQYKQLWNSLGTFCIVKNMENQNPTEIQGYLTTTVRSWLMAWLCVEDRLKYVGDCAVSRPINNLSIRMSK
ncbi:hypothetical protein GOP47_0021415 [Adiantum capillus-veneris]|uniref:FCP1 homology domain-containing protein n=1 Tax=Adiantum capillus-veneris TaxID=13818 RepID=A0A9D4U8B6_ADICA|nr:hypothetical protein GOP47_0021415 [Adiantum capillus-veneris]